MRDEPGQESSAERRAGELGYARRHPVITGTLVACCAAGAVLGFAWLSDDWSAARRIAAGAVAGGGIGLLLTATKMFD